MAALKTVVTSGSEALAAATAETLLQLVAPAQQRIAVRGLGISFDGVTAGATPVLVQLVKQTTAGTASPATPVRDGDVGSETIQMTAQKDFTVEPTTTDVLREWFFHPQAGGIEINFGIDEMIYIPGGGRLGLRVTAPAVVNAVCHIKCEE